MLANLKWRILLAQLTLNVVVLCVFYVYLHGSVADRADLVPVTSSQWESTAVRVPPWLGARLTALPVQLTALSVRENGTESSDAVIETGKIAKREFDKATATAVENKDTVLGKSIGNYSHATTTDTLASHLATTNTETNYFVLDKAKVQQRHLARQMRNNPQVARSRFQHTIAAKMEMDGKEEQYRRLVEGMRLQWRKSQTNVSHEEPEGLDAWYRLETQRRYPIDVRQNPYRRLLLQHIGGTIIPGKLDPSDTVLAATVQEDMERCGRQLGVSEELMRYSSNNMSIASERMAQFINVFKSFMPKHNRFISGFKNPCWHLPHDDEQPTDKAYRTDLKSKRMLLCLPYFFVPGFMKSGTSSLFDALSRHPDIVATSTKEPQWWHRVPIARDTYTGTKIAHDVRRYLSVFLRPSRVIAMLSSSITLDASADTINRSPCFVNDQEYCTLPIILSKVLPQAKFIVIMRNPVTRTYSHFLYACTQKFSYNITQWPEEVRSQPAELFHQQAVISIQQFNSCLQSRGLFECTNLWRFYSRSVDRCGEVGFRLVNSIYYSYLVKWLQFFPKEHFLFLRTEDIDSKTSELMNQITEFLGISPLSATKAQLLFSHSMNQQRFTSQKGFQLKEKTVSLLQDFFKPYNAMLVKLIGGTTFLWDD